MKDKDIAIKVCKAIYETVREAGTSGAPRGVIYLAMSTLGLTYDVYLAVESKLVEAGMIRVENQCLFAVPQ